MKRFLSVVQGVAWRSIHNTIVNPAILVPSIVFPLFFLIAFAGGLSRIGDVPNFHYPPGYTSFQFVFVFLQSAAFGGVFTGFAVARDFDSGFARRLLLSAPRRGGIIVGYTVGALRRWVLTGTVVTIAALIAGMNVDGSGVQLIGLLALGVALNLVAALWACGLAMFLRTEQAGALIQMPVFVTPVPGARVRPPVLAHRLDTHHRQPQSGDPGTGGRPRPARGIAGQGGDRVCRASRSRARPGRLRPTRAHGRRTGRLTHASWSRVGIARVPRGAVALPPSVLLGGGFCLGCGRSSNCV